MKPFFYLFPSFFSFLISTSSFSFSLTHHFLYLHPYLPPVPPSFLFFFSSSLLPLHLHHLFPILLLLLLFHHHLLLLLLLLFFCQFPSLHRLSMPMHVQISTDTGALTLPIICQWFSKDLEGKYWIALVYVSVCLSVCLFVCLFVCLSG